jgi:hypothetical protein
MLFLVKSIMGNILAIKVLLFLEKMPLLIVIEDRSGLLLSFAIVLRIQHLIHFLYRTYVLVLFPHFCTLQKPLISKR